jgi:hypothetical protein
METLFPSPFQLVFYAAPLPANCAAIPAGTLLWTSGLIGGSDWLAAASGGSASYNFALYGPITGSCSNTGTIAFFRMYFGATAFMQGTCGTSGADFILSDNVVVAGQVINVTSLTFNEGGA